MKTAANKKKSFEEKSGITKQKSTITGSEASSGRSHPESEIKYRALFDNAPIGISIIDCDRNVLESNRSLQKVVKISDYGLRSGLYKKRRYLRSDGSEISVDELPSSRAIREGKPILDVEIGIADDGKIVRWTQVSAAPLDLTGTCAVVITQDITERKILQKELVENEARYRALFENSMDALILSSPDGKIHSANPAACTMLGYTEKQIRRMGREGVVDNNDPRLSDGLKNRSVTGKFYGEITMIKRGGIKFPVEISSAIFSDAEGRQLTSMVIRDISERKKAETALRESEERHRLLMENSGLGIGYFDIDGKILMFNQVAINNLGGKSSDFIGKNLTEVFGKEAGQTYIDRIKLTAESEMPVQYEEYVKLRSKPGWYLSTHSRILDQNGSVDGIQVISDNITERKNTEIKLKESQKKLRDLTRHLVEVREMERSQIALNLHDDLGQKLTALTLDIAWLKSRIGVQSQPVREKLLDMSLRINEAIESIKEISSFLRPSILFDLGLVPAFEWQLQKFEKQSGINCHFYHDPEEIKIEDQIALMLYRILQESLTNIVRHSEASIVSVNLLQFQNKIELLIEDNGRGISEEDILALTSTGIVGIKERVRSINGKVSIKGEKGSGTIISVSIPIKKRIKS